MDIRKHFKSSPQETVTNRASHGGSVRLIQLGPSQDTRQGLCQLRAKAKGGRTGGKQRRLWKGVVKVSSRAQVWHAASSGFYLQLKVLRWTVT